MLQFFLALFYFYEYNPSYNDNVFDVLIPDLYTALYFFPGFPLFESFLLSISVDFCIRMAAFKKVAPKRNPAA